MRDSGSRMAQAARTSTRVAMRPRRRMRLQHLAAGLTPAMVPDPWRRMRGGQEIVVACAARKGGRT